MGLPPHRNCSTEGAMKREIKPGSYLFPMPAVLVGALVDDKPNYMVAAYVGMMNFRPPVIYAALNRNHYTTGGINGVGTFSVNIPHTGLVVKTDYSGLVSGKTVDKSTLFSPFYGKLKTAPMIQECPLCLEVRLMQTVEFPVDIAFIGEIVSVYCDEQYMTGDLPDIEQISPIIFDMAQKRYFSVGRFLGKAWDIGKGFKSGG
jgi:flavin reductase (DIM6/NTAB) family NADH-FMN oxidoreductase RutF